MLRTALRQVAVVAVLTEQLGQVLQIDGTVAGEERIRRIDVAHEQGGAGGDAVVTEQLGQSGRSTMQLKLAMSAWQ